MKTLRFAGISFMIGIIGFMGINFIANDVQASNYRSLQSYNYPDHFIRHRNYFGEITRIVSQLDRKDATFRIVPGLANSRYVSFESLNYPGYYLRHQGFRIKLHRRTPDLLFRKDATFKKVPGLANRSWVSFESYNYPGRFIRHRGYHLYIESGNTDLFRKDATFRFVQPKYIGGGGGGGGRQGKRHSFQSFNYPDHFIRHRNYFGEITRIVSQLDRKDATFRIVPGLADSRYVSFESVNYPGYYLRHQGFRIKLHRRTSDLLFRKDATFKRVPGLANRSWVSFESYNYPGRFIRHRGYHLYIESGNTDLFRKDATFRIVGPKW